MEHIMLWHIWFKFSAMTIGIMFIASGLTASPDSSKATLPNSTNLLPTRSTTDNSTDTNSVFILEARHRVFTDFLEVDTVRMDEKFEIGDGNAVGQIFTFNPHLTITEKGEYIRVSDTLYNPAVRVRVYQKDSVVQESWAFYYSEAPHFRRSDILGFRLLNFQVADKYIRVKGPKMPEPSPADSTEKKSK